MSSRICPGDVVIKNVTHPAPPNVVAGTPVTVVIPKSSQWLRENVHDWSRDMQALLVAEYPDLPTQSLEHVCYLDRVCTEMRAKYTNPMVDLVLNKMTTRKAIKDSDLRGVMPAGLLCMVWLKLVMVINTPECYQHFLDTLVDIAGTCVQGDTHRLFSTYVALTRSLQENII